MTRPQPSKTDLIKALASAGNAHNIIVREVWSNGQETIESHRYTANEMAEIFDRDQLVILSQGKVLERAAIAHAPKALYVSAEAMARLAFNANGYR